NSHPNYPEKPERATAALLLFAVCQRSLPLSSPPENFPKASAKVRQFRKLTKFFRGFFQKKRNFFPAHAAEAPGRRGTESTDCINGVQKK
ncbi:MAG: hypothetical protein J5770_03170, partial [Bacteroidaceae bacterium]|nr:hypothetical protein [Bacteroidaceae bacterium]